MKNFEMNTISVNDVLHTLRECERDDKYEGMFEHMLTFASELTGISEDYLYSSMYQENTLKEINIDIYKTLTYDEDEKKRIPFAYCGDTLGGNRKCQHVTIRDPKIINEFLSRFELSQITNDNLALSILWNLPRKQYGETDMWVHLSGFTYSNEPPFSPVKFVIADNVVTEAAQKKAVEALEFLQEKFSNIEVDYGVPEYRSECNCKTDAKLAEKLDEAHKAENGFNYEIGESHNISSMKPTLSSQIQSATNRVTEAHATMELKNDEVSFAIKTENPIYVAIFNFVGDYYNFLQSCSEELVQRFSKDCSVSLVNGDTLCFRGLNGQEISDLMEAMGSDYDYSYDSPEDAWRTLSGQIQSASTRAGESHSTSGVKAKESEPEH